MNPEIKYELHRGKSITVRDTVHEIKELRDSCMSRGMKAETLKMFMIIKTEIT